MELLINNNWTTNNKFNNFGTRNYCNEMISYDDKNDLNLNLDPLEAYKLMENLVQDWKSRMEGVMGSTLKKMRRNLKELNISIQQENMKNSVFNDWKQKFIHEMDESSRKMDQVNKSIAKYTYSIINNKIYESSYDKNENLLNQNKKTIVNMGFNTENGFASIKQLVEELEKICSNLGTEFGYQNFKNLMPIYSVSHTSSSSFEKAKISQMEKFTMPMYKELNAITTLLPDIPKIEESNISEDTAEILDSTWSKVDKKKRTPQNNTNNTKRDSMKASTMRIVHLNKNGEDRFFLVKKKTKFVKVSAEDVFQEWLNIFDSNNDHKPIRKPRVRKISQRSLRKELIKKGIEDEYSKKKSLSYSDIVKKNLKSYEPSRMEDIFQLWRQIFTHPDEKEIIVPISQCDANIPRDYSMEIIFSKWKHILDPETYSKKAERKFNHNLFNDEMIYYVDWRKCLMNDHNSEIIIEDTKNENNHHQNPNKNKNKKKQGKKNAGKRHKHF